uniref:Uncharacterized protein n=1 Tax=uncultured organism TaxID=155900 RepID=A0A7L9QBU2_9ZZZZ|nr:hypothetical protein [uncultured organism]
METITTQTAVELLEAAVELAGADRMYEVQPGAAACKYVHGDNPGCIVGVALSIHGVPLDVLQSWDDDYQQGLGIGSLFHHGRAPFLTKRAADVLRAAQKIQDMAIWSTDTGGADLTWGAALIAARSEAARSDVGDE